MYVATTSLWLAAAHLMQLSALLEMITLTSNSHALYMPIKTQVNQLSDHSDYDTVKLNLWHFQPEKSKVTSRDVQKGECCIAVQLRKICDCDASTGNASRSTISSFMLT
jgi:hypothetical protein